MSAVEIGRVRLPIPVRALGDLGKGFEKLSPGCTMRQVGDWLVISRAEEVEPAVGSVFDEEWWVVPSLDATFGGVLKPSRAIEYRETTEWRAARVAEGARVMTADEWEAAHPRAESGGNAKSAPTGDDSDRA